MKFPFNLCDMRPNTHQWTLKNIFKKCREKPLVFLYMEYFVENRQDLRNLHQMKFCL